MMLSSLRAIRRPSSSGKGCGWAVGRVPSLFCLTRVIHPCLLLLACSACTGYWTLGWIRKLRTRSITVLRASATALLLGRTVRVSQLVRGPARQPLRGSPFQASISMAPSTALAAVKDVALPSEGADAGGEKGWCDLCVPPAELRPELSLTMGQCFNWKRRGAGVQDDGEDQEWVGVLGRAVLAVRQTPTSTLFRILATADKSECADSMVSRLRDYFQLEVPLRPLYERWGQADRRMKEVAKHIPGVRVIRQDPVECLFSFICSSNNNIARITLMLDRLRTAYGQPLGMDEYCAFPSVERLSEASEAELRKLGFGYRAKFIVETAKKLQELGGADWLLSLRRRPRKEVQEALLVFPGVGRKVADCVALFSLDQQGAIPVDVHVWRIACRDYDSTLKASKSLTPTIYERVGDMFRERFGDCAGWAHSLLFAAELPNYRVRLPPELQADMVAFKREEKEEKAVKRDEAKKRKLQQEEETVVVQPCGGDSDTDSIGSISMSEVEEDDGQQRPVVSILHADTTVIKVAAAAATVQSTTTTTSSSSISATCTASVNYASSVDVPVTPDVANIRRRGEAIRGRRDEEQVLSKAQTRRSDAGRRRDEDGSNT